MLHNNVTRLVVHKKDPEMNLSARTLTPVLQTAESETVQTTTTTTALTGVRS